MQRRYDLDWLRVIAFALLMLFHTGMMFSTWDWHVKNIETSDAFDFVMRWLHAWRMPLLFFISGSAVWFAMDRYSNWRFFLERQKRLLLPLIFGMLVIIPPQVYVERLYHQQFYDSFWDFYRTIFTTGSYPEGNLSWHHLWYVPYIWAFSMLMFPLFIAVRSSAGRRLLGWGLTRLQRPWTLFLLFLPSALAELILRPIWPGDANNLVADWANFTHKLTFFVAGFLLASGTGVYDVIAVHRRKFLILGVVASAILQPIWVADWRPPGLTISSYRFFSNFHIWMWLLALLGYGRKYLSFNHPFLRCANEAVYPFYILHQTVIILLAYQLAYVNWGIPLKFLVVATSTFSICWVIYAFAIKPWNLLRVAFGMKWMRPRELVGADQGVRAPMPVRVSGALGLVLVCIITLTSCSRHSGRIVCRTINAPSLSPNVMGISPRQTMAIYLPPSYSDANRRFPVLYLLPNFKCDLWRYTGATFQGFRLKDAMDKQISSGAAKEMIVVLPNTTHFLGGSFYRNSPLTGNWEDYIVRDVVQYVDTHFRTIAAANARALAGHGVGGFGALELGLKHPELFSSVYGMSPAVFDPNGAEEFARLGKKAAASWPLLTEQWNKLDPVTRRRSFRDHVQKLLNSPSRQVFLQGLFISYGAAVSPQLSLPYPHIAFPAMGATSSSGDPLARCFADGLGGWDAKLDRYVAGKGRLHAITIEYGRDDEYDWIRHGAEYVSSLMRSKGIAIELAIHEGSHESKLGRRLETAMLPAISNSLRHD